jgi:hypothetical protein
MDKLSAAFALLPKNFEQMLKQQEQKCFKQNKEFLNDKFVELILHQCQKKLKKYIKQRYDLEKPSPEQIEKNYKELIHELAYDLYVFIFDNFRLDINEILYTYQKILYVFNEAKINGYLKEGDLDDFLISIREAGNIGLSEKNEPLLTKIFKLPEYKVSQSTSVIDDKLKQKVKDCELPEKTEDEIELEEDFQELLKFYNDDNRENPSNFTKYLSSVRCRRLKQLLL